MLKIILGLALGVISLFGPFWAWSFLPAEGMVWWFMPTLLLLFGWFFVGLVCAAGLIYDGIMEQKDETL